MYSRIIEVLSKTQTEEAAVCRVINSRMSKQGLPKLVVPSHLFPAVGLCNPYWDLIVVQFVSPTEPKRDNNGSILKEHYSYAKTFYAATAKIEVENDTVYWKGLPDGFRYPVGKLGEESIYPFEWPVKATQKRAGSVEEPKPEKGRLTNLEAIEALTGAMKALPLDLKGRHSHGGYLFEKYVYVQTLSEYAFAIGMNEREVGGKWLSTHLRTLMPLPWGGIKTTRKTSRAMSEEDKLQLEGKDIELFDRDISNIHRKTPIKGKASIDVKLIASVGEPSVGDKRYSDVPVEALTESVNLHNSHPNKYNFYDDSMWTWSKKGDADIGYIIRNHAYVVPKRRLQEAVKKRVEKMRITGMEYSNGLRPNIHENKGIRKWCAWFSEKEIEAMATVDFELPAIYGELLDEHATTLLDLYGHPDLGEAYTNRQLRYFNRYI